ncbi:MAG: carbohydrate-binding protein [Chitinivibrionales bacterium]
MWKNKTAVVMFVIIMQIFVNNPVSAQDVVISLNTENQVIKGFGGINHPVWIADLTPEQRNTAFGNGEDQLGFSILRMHIDPNSSNWSREVATAQKAVELGATVFASPWNPPDHMTETIDGDKRLRYDMYDDYTDHLNDFISYMSDNGVDLYAISVQNEPDYAEDWTWWSPDEILTYMKENAGNLQTRVMAPESFQYRKNISDPILNDPAALANLDILGAHLYGTQIGDFPYPLFEEKGEGKELWMTEVYYPNSEANSADRWPEALEVAWHIHSAMVEADFQAYVWWYIRREYGPMKEDGTISKRGHCMAHFSKFVRPGYIRVDATKEPESDVYISAYKGGDSVVVVAVNQSTSSQTINSSSPSTTVESFTQFTTTGSKDFSNEGSVSVTDDSCSVTLDAQSVSTLAGSGEVVNIPQTPYNDSPHQIPGRIEAEEYDNGGEGSAYHEENSEGNQGDATFRDDQVDIEVTGDETGDYNICYILNNEWLEYTVTVDETREYSLDLRVANEGDAKSLHVEVDSVDVTGPVEIPGTEGWQNWTTVNAGDIELSQGEHEIRLAFDSDYINLNYMEWHIPTKIEYNNSAKSEMLPVSFAGAGFRISLKGNFTYRITSIKGEMIEAGKGRNSLRIGAGLAQGVYMLSVESDLRTFNRKIFKR